MSMAITCKICGHVEQDYLADHLAEAHGLSVADYLAQHENAPTTSQRLLDRWEKERANARRKLPPEPDELEVEIAGIPFKVNPDVPANACLTLPHEYRCPRHGSLGKDIQHATIAIKRGRSVWVWGLPGSGKSALFHAIPAMCRMPSKLFQVQQGIDIQNWFYSRALGKEGTSWEAGELFEALTKGYTDAKGKVHPYLILIDDFDKADRSQAEALRLVTDSIQGRVRGPDPVTGKLGTFPIIAGTIVVVTANTAGGGDERGRMIAANVMDASLLDRFERKFQFHWMTWKDEEPIVRAKFPLLVEKAPEVFSTMGAVTETLRKAIASEELYAEFSHRALCSILGHAEDLIYCTGGRVPSKLLKKAARAWLDGLPDEETRQAARNLIDPHLKGGAVDEGDTSHIDDGNLADGWS
jgi:MoxR-like ATPase